MLSKNLFEINIKEIPDVEIKITFFEGKQVSVIPGDINDDKTIDLKDAIISLQIISGIIPNEIFNKASEVDGNNKIGLEEVICILQNISGLKAIRL